MTKRDAQEITAMLAAYYTNWKPQAETLELYETLLVPLDADLAKQTVMHFMRTSTAEFVPKVATIARLAAQLDMEAAGTPFISAEEAWVQVEQAIRRDGFYRSPQVNHERIQKAIDAIGWQNLCTSENLVADRAHFFRIFEAIQERSMGDRIEQLLTVAGLPKKAIEGEAMGRLEVQS